MNYKTLNKDEFLPSGFDIMEEGMVAVNGISKVGGVGGIAPLPPLEVRLPQAKKDLKQAIKALEYAALRVVKAKAAFDECKVGSVGDDRSTSTNASGDECDILLIVYKRRLSIKERLRIRKDSMELLVKRLQIALDDKKRALDKNRKDAIDSLLKDESTDSPSKEGETKSSYTDAPKMVLTLIAVAVIGYIGIKAMK